MALLVPRGGGRGMGVVALLSHPPSVGDAVDDPFRSDHLHRVRMALGTLVLGLRISSRKKEREQIKEGSTV